MDRERHNEFMKRKGRLLDENIEAVQRLNKVRKALKENNKRITDDITRLKGDLEELGMEEKKCIKGWRKELKNYLKAGIHFIGDEDGICCFLSYRTDVSK